MNGCWVHLRESQIITSIDSLYIQSRIASDPRVNVIFKKLISLQYVDKVFFPCAKEDWYSRLESNHFLFRQHLCMMKQTWVLKVPNQEYIAQMGGENHFQLENRGINSYVA